MSLFLPDEKIGPVKEVEDSKDSWEDNPGEEANLSSSKMEVMEPRWHMFVWYPGE